MKKLLLIILMISINIACKQEEGDVFPYPIEIDMVGYWDEYQISLYNPDKEVYLWSWEFKPDGTADRIIRMNPGTANENIVKQDMLWEYVDPTIISGASHGFKMTYVMSTPNGCVPCFYNSYWQNARVENQKRLIVTYSQGCSSFYNEDWTYVLVRR